MDLVLDGDIQTLDIYNDWRKVLEYELARRIGKGLTKSLNIMPLATTNVNHSWDEASCEIGCVSVAIRRFVYLSCTEDS